jgi:hypothetical protein
VPRTFSLDSGQSETLRVAPTRKVLNVSTFSKGGSIEKVGNVINLYFEGNWMPIKVRTPWNLIMRVSLARCSWGWNARISASAWTASSRINLCPCQRMKENMRTGKTISCNAMPQQCHFAAQGYNAKRTR